MLKQIENNGYHAIYDNVTHKPILGGLNKKATLGVIELLKQHDEFYAIINKRTGKVLEEPGDKTAYRFMSKEDAVSFARGYGGCMAVKEDFYLGESRKPVPTAIRCGEVIKGTPNADLKQKWKDFFVIGDTKSAIGSFTMDVNEMNYIKGYIYNSVKSSIIWRAKSKKAVVKRDTRALALKDGFDAIRKNRDEANTAVVHAAISEKLGQRQKRRLAGLVIREARKQGLL